MIVVFNASQLNTQYTNHKTLHSTPTATATKTIAKLFKVFVIKEFKIFFLNF